MNLVQIQDRLRGMPIQLLQQYANGSNPEVPPYIALGVLKQKETEMQQHSNAQGAAQGQMPSVKSQLEQKVGTLQQQASMMPQGMTQPAAPAPQGPVQMAGGGLTSGNAGSAMKFAEGGIIGYAGGGEAKRIRYANEGENVLPDTTGYEGMGLWDAIKAMGGDFQDYLAATEQQSLQGPTTTRTVGTGGAGRGAVNPPEVSSEAPAPTGIAAGVQRPPVVGGIAQRTPGAAPAAAPGAPAPAGAGLGGSSVAAMLQKQLGKEPVAPTAAGAAQSVQDINKQFGLDTPAGAEERAMIAKMNAQREGQTQDRGLQNLITYLTNARGSNIGETFASGARASQSEIEKQHADDLAHQQKMYEMVSGLNKANRAENVGSAGKAATLFGEQEKSAAEADRAKLQALTQAYGSNVQAGAHVQSAQIMASAREAGLDSKEIQAAEAAYARDPEAASIKKQMENPIVANNPVKMQDAITKLRAIQASKYAQFGLKMEGTTPSAGAGGTPPPGAVRLKQ